MRSRSRALRPLLTLAASVVAIGCSDGSGSGDLVRDYCRYGSVSEAQLEGCYEHVTADDVRGYQTHASQYAFGDLDECLADAGPFCEPREE